MQHYKFGTLLLVAALGASELAIAQAPAPAPAPAAVPLTPASAQTTTVAPAAPPAAGAVSADERKRLDDIKWARSQGFKPQQRNGATVYCRDTTPIGSRFSTVECKPEEQLADLRRQQQEQKDEIDAMHGCAGAGCSRK